MHSKTHLRSIPMILAAAASLGGLGRRFNFDPPEPDNAHNQGDAGEAPPNPPAQPDHIARLRTEFSTLQNEAQGVIDAAAAANRGLTDAETTANNTRFTRMTAIQNLITERQRFASLQLAGGADDGEDGGDRPAPRVNVQRPRGVPGEREFQATQDQPRGNPDIRVTEPKIDRRQFSDALRNWAATGVMDRRFATITTATNAGVLLPRTIEVPIIPTHSNVFREAIAYHGMKPITTTTTHQMEIPVITMAAGAVVAENVNAETENEPDTSAKLVLKPETYGSGAAWFSNNVLQANDWDIVEWINTDLLFAKELALESAIATALIADAGITQIVNTATTAGFTYANLVSLNNALPKRYDRFKVIVLSQTAWNAAEGMVDSTGAPILALNPQNDRLRTFNGTPVMRCDFLQALGAATRKVGFVISMSAFKLRDAGQQRLARYTNDKARRDQTGLDLFGYHDFDWADEGVACFRTP